jgi:hypothetical protein
MQLLLGGLVFELRLLKSDKCKTLKISKNIAFNNC